MASFFGSRSSVAPPEVSNPEPAKMDPRMSVTEALFGKKNEDPVWQDREIRFDLGPADLKCRRGEQALKSMDEVEDTKGNNGEKGDLVITNLRIMWISKRQRRTNISVGYNCITNLTIKDASSRLKGPTQALYVLTRSGSQRFEFIFTNVASDSGGLFSALQAVHRAYDGSRLYRDLKLRGALLQDKELKLLPAEQTYSRVSGVWNLSSEQGNLGTFYITNVRLVWFANLTDNFNVSIPYMQIKSLKVRESKYGTALVVETSSSSGGYVLGFKIDPRETLEYVHKEIKSLWQVYSSKPMFGVECNIDETASTATTLKLASLVEDVEVVETDRSDYLAAYYADGGKALEREPVYCSELGLAIESIKDGLTIEQLWNVV